MTSANTTYYTITDLAGKEVGKHSQSHYCKPRWEELLGFSPPEKYNIQAYGFDEEEAPWEDDPINLREFLIDRRIIKDITIKDKAIRIKSKLVLLKKDVDNIKFEIDFLQTELQLSLNDFSKLIDELK
jgi:hypothetical protein